jgi:hypothetical protein
VEVKTYPEESYNSKHNLEGDNVQLNDGLKVIISRKEEGTKSNVPEVAFGTYLNKTHFSAFVSREFITSSFGEAPKGAPRASGDKRVCVLWDVSQSCRPKAERSLQFFTDLEADHAAQNEKVTFTLKTFSTLLDTLGERLSAEEVVKKLSEVIYDGGTNLAVLGDVFRAQHEKWTNFDYFVLFTDGVDNVGDGTRIPEGISPELGTAIHIITPGTFTSSLPPVLPLIALSSCPPCSSFILHFFDLILDVEAGVTVNDNLLKCITTQTRGHLQKLSPRAAHVISGTEEEFAITNVLPVIHGEGGEGSVVLDLFCDEDFQTVPDCRLPDKSWWPLRESGALVSGKLAVLSSPPSS